MTTSDGIQVLDQGVGYGVVVGIGAFFALLMLAITWMQNRYTSYSTKQAEEFNTASRSVKPGLIAAGIVSSWTWSATLLTSSTFAYSYGICGPMWYGAMGTSQILLFSLIAIKIKANAPGAHTFPEIILARHGRAAHLTYLFFGFATNMLVGACLVLGGAQVVAALSGVNVYGVIFLIPLVVAAYVIAGGLRSTFIADYAHTVILFIAIFVFCFSMYATSDVVGSIDKFYDLLQEASKKMPIAGNHNGSYLTFKSNDGLVFAIDLLVAGFSNVWLDQAYWQRAIASRPETSVKAYLFGGMAWYGIPFSFGTAMGLGCAALTVTSAFPTFPNPLTAAQNGAGLSAPASAVALLGKGGAGLMLLLLFMAVTSATSAELIAVSSLITFDVYKTYIKPTATSTGLVRISHYGIVLYAVILAAFCCILNAVNVNLTWVLTILGVIVGGASIPVGLILLWPPMSTVATLVSPWTGLMLGMIAWLVTTQYRSGKITVTTSGDVTNALAGNLVSCGSGTILAFVLSFVFPDKSDTTTDPEMRKRIAKINGVRPRAEDTTSSPASEKVAQKTGDGDNPSNEHDRGTDPAHEPGSDPKPDTVVPTGNAVVDFLEASHVEPMSPEDVKKATILAQGFNLVYWCIVIILVPFTLFGTEWEFTRAGFTGWCVVSFIWAWISMIICVVWPLVESRGTMWAIARGLVRDAGGGGLGRAPPDAGSSA
ncbi:Uu.00g119490.m01.CDS01 [Anthostomella pinea]|uniref:Uu.00g119490.m01.CDS01 n=1 Tax=Anthostomella pinea TaxID=933095 RepID=A0AAI8VHL2_9PEZI|nr:Uu.00g119490.m01.CDS01 [Anthostomella pinea]